MVAVPEENWSPLRSWHCALMRSGAGFFAGMRLDLFALDLADLVHAALVASAGKGRVQELLDNGPGLGIIEKARADGEDVGVVMFARESGFFLIRNVGGADAGNFVRGDGHADARAADEQSEVYLLRGDLFADFAGEVGIIHRLV